MLVCASPGQNTDTRTGLSAITYRRWPSRTQLLAAAIDRRVAPLGVQPIDTGGLREDVIAVLTAMNSRCRAAEIVPDPGGDLTAYLRRQAAAEGFEQMNLVLHRAHQRGEIDTRSLSTQVGRLPVNVLHSELCLGATSVPARLIAEIVDEVFLPLAQITRCERPSRASFASS